MPLEIAAAIGQPPAKRLGCHASMPLRYPLGQKRRRRRSVRGPPYRRSAALAGEPLGLLLVALDLLGQLRDGIGIELFRLLNQFLALLVAIDEAVETFLGHVAGALAFVCHRRIPY